VKSSATWTRKKLEALARRRPGSLVDLVIDLQRRMRALEERLAQNSSNSHRPPSSDGYAKPDPKSLRKPSGRNSGGQKGHPGATLTPAAKPDRIVTCRLKRCPCGCGADLRDQPLLRHEIRQVFDLPPQKLIVTEFRVEVKLCPNNGIEVSASFPAGVNAPAQYGPRFNAWLVYLRCQQLIPLERISQMCADLFARPVSEATVQAAVAAAYHGLAGFESRVADLIAQAHIAHADETGLRVAGKPHWLHVVSTEILTWYGVHRRRGGAAIRHFALLPRFAGRLIHDCLSAYFDLDCLHGLCNAHLLRELTFLHEVLHQKWAKLMLDLLIRIHRAVAAHRARAGPTPLRQQTAWTRKYRSALRAGFAENPLPKPPPGPRPRGRPKHTKAQNLLLRLQQHEGSVLAFLHDPRVPFTNNQGEQDIRMMKVQQKISGAFRTLHGARMFARIRAYLSTARKNQRNVFRETSAIFTGQPFMPCATA
jgi:transposase